MDETTIAALALADWRRRVAELWVDWRRDAVLDHATATAVFRSARDALFRDHPQSPLPPDERAAFSGLGYWPYDPAWRMTARLETTDDRPGSAGSRTSDLAGGGPPRVAAAPSSGPSDAALQRIGHVALSGPLDGERLPVYWIEGYVGGIFIPFRDATSGTQTYGAGRYLLDTAKSADHGVDPATGELILDFNLAYHPSCAYDARWSCPLAPPEARVRAAVQAGERLP